MQGYKYDQEHNKGGSVVIDAGVQSSLILARKHLFNSLGAVAFRPLERRAKCTVPDELGRDSEGTRNTEENGVELHLVEAIE